MFYSYHILNKLLSRQFTTWSFIPTPFVSVLHMVYIFLQSRTWLLSSPFENVFHFMKACSLKIGWPWGDLLRAIWRNSVIALLIRKRINTKLFIDGRWSFLLVWEQYKREAIYKAESNRWHLLLACLGGQLWRRKVIVVVGS